ncbi:hypothetical protein ARTSIC4J27_3164 [Pseudarthrobacter siccitolerans]|uniref:Uncharacterized protein n=1 Tax=Pseudarthrobacter siccitolerans TaxID=861266 RepID=A0A024H5Y9_9MICC|nr:hypothetical protein [Pseudarthrobacter siccitolerans]CCQ47184.1 hypothetical protein ARTSIC4J27_3164 [Pseudarthrobacter siccitolerans]
MTSESVPAEGVENFLDFKLSGGRFEVDGFPLDAMGELANYQRLLFEVAKDLWRSKNPNKKTLPRHFEDQLRLGLKVVRNGSAVPVAVRPRELELQGQPDLLAESKEFINAAFEKIVQDFELPAGLSPDTISAFKAIARDLDSKESYQFRQGTEEAVVYNTRLRRRLLGQLDDAPPKSSGVLVGNIKSLDPFDQTFVLRTAAGGEIPGEYSDVARFEELHEAMNLPTDAAWVRLRCEFSIKHGKRKDRVVRIHDVENFESFDVQKGPLSVELAELASLNPGWLDGDGEIIELPSIEFARDLLGTLQEERLAQPAVFPTEAGGVQLEWLSQQRHIAITVEPDLTIEAFFLDASTDSRELANPVGIAAVRDFVRRHLNV